MNAQIARSDGVAVDYVYVYFGGGVVSWGGVGWLVSVACVRFGRAVGVAWEW